MSNISREIYNRMNQSHIFNSVLPDKKISNIKPIKIELKKENDPKTKFKAKNGLYKPFINKKNKEKEKDKKRNYNESDIFFTNSLTPRTRQKLKEEVFPKKEEYISNYKPENYVKFQNSSFDKKMHDFYKEKGDKFSADKTKLRGKPKKVLVSSKGYNEYIEKYSNDNYSNNENLRRNILNQGQIEKIFYNKENKYKPNSSSIENYNREFESNIFNVKNNNYRKYIKSSKASKKSNKSVDTLKTRNINSKGTLKWPANLNWTEDTEALFKSHVKNAIKNYNMTAFDRNQIDSVKNLIEGSNSKRQTNNNKIKKSKKTKSDLSITEYKRPLFDKIEYTLSRAKKLSNNYSILEDEKEYQNNVKINNLGGKYEIKEYKVIKPGNIDIFEFEKIIKSKGVHLIEINEKKDIIKYDNKDVNDRILQLKVRENIFDKKKNEKLKSIEKELKKKNRQLQIKLAPKQKNHRLRSADFMYKKINKKNQSSEKFKS